MKKLEFGIGQIEVGHVAIAIAMLLLSIFFGVL